jgi:hypothetical protein
MPEHASFVAVLVLPFLQGLVAFVRKEHERKNKKDARAQDPAVSRCSIPQEAKSLQEVSAHSSKKRSDRGM